MSDTDESARDMRELDDAIVGNIPPASRVTAPVRWYGGKGRLGPWIVQYIPQSKVYCEPFAGAASVLWHLKPRPVEVLNDVDGELVNFYRVMQDEDTFRELRHRLVWTLYSREEFRRALEMSEDAKPVDHAWAFYVRQNQGFGGKANAVGDWSRSFLARSHGGADNTSMWRMRLTQLKTWHDRLSRVQIDNRDAIECIRYWDSAETAFYVDPPYVADTRVDKDVYANELDDNYYVALIETLLAASGTVVLSGYDHPLFSQFDDAGWSKQERKTACHVAGRSRSSKIRGKGSVLEHAGRTECLWINRTEQGQLF